MNLEKESKKMSKHETWRTRKYWESIGGLLVEEFVVVSKTKTSSRRTLDGVIILGEKKSIHPGNFFEIQNKDVIVIQTKPTKLNMSLLGQTFFSGELIKKHNPKSIKLVAICKQNDEILHECAVNKKIEVVIIND